MLILWDLPVILVEHKVSNDEFTAEFGENVWNYLEDEIYNCYSLTLMKIKVEKHHVGYINPGGTISIKWLIIVHIFWKSFQSTWMI